MFPHAFHRSLRAAVAAGMLLPGLTFEALAFDLQVTTSKENVRINTTNSYFITITNGTGTSLSGVFVTNLPSLAVEIDRATNSLIDPLNPNSTVVIIESNAVVFPISLLPANGVAELGLDVVPTELGNLTNTVILSVPGRTNLPIITTNVVTVVYRDQADLSVSLTGPPSDVFVNDWMTYSVTVSNSGVESVSGVQLSNGLPADVGLLTVNPSSQAYTRTNGSVLFDLGTIGGGGSVLLSLTVQPTNAGTLPLSAMVNSTGLLDTNAVNDSATSNITVNAFLTGQLVAVTNSTQQFNPQTGLMDQTILLSNIGTTDVASARVNVAGLTNRLYNAVGTNDGSPYVIYGSSLAAGASIELLLEYFIPTRLPGAEPVMTAFAIPAFDGSVSTNASFNITRITNLAPDRVLIEFEAEGGKSYTIIYSDSMDFSDARAAQPTLIAPSGVNKVQWIDEGPPKTVSPPTNMMRMYRVIQNQ